MGFLQFELQFRDDCFDRSLRGGIICVGRSTKYAIFITGARRVGLVRKLLLNL